MESVSVAGLRPPQGRKSHQFHSNKINLTSVIPFIHLIQKSKSIDCQAIIFINFSFWNNQIIFSTTKFNLTKTNKIINW